MSKRAFDFLLPLGDDKDSVPVHGLMPSKMKKLEDLEDQSFGDCPKGVFLGMLLGSILWVCIILSWVLLT